MSRVGRGGPQGYNPRDHGRWKVHNSPLAHYAQQALKNTVWSSL